MNTEPKYILWVNADLSQYYLIPTEASLPEGDLLLHTLAGRAQQVDAEAAATWVVSRAEAETFLQNAAATLFQGAPGLIAGLFPETAAAPTTPVSEPEAGGALSLAAIAALLGMPVEALQNNPQLNQLGLHRLLIGLADVLADVIAGDPARLDVARERVRQFRADLSARDIHVHARLEALPDKVAAWYAKSEQKVAFHNFEALLRQLAERVQPSDGSAPLDLQQLLAELRAGLAAVFGEPSETPEQRRERYRAMARRTLDQNTPPKFDFKKLWAEYNKSQEPR